MQRARMNNRPCEWAGRPSWWRVRKETRMYPIFFGFFTPDTKTFRETRLKLHRAFRSGPRSGTHTGTRREPAWNHLGRPLAMIKRIRIYRRRPDAILFLRFHPATAWLKGNTSCFGIRIQDCNQLIFQLYPLSIICSIRFIAFRENFVLSKIFE